MAFDKFAKEMKGSAAIEKAEKEGLSERYVSKQELALCFSIYCSADMKCNFEFRYGGDSVTVFWKCFL